MSDSVRTILVISRLPGVGRVRLRNLLHRLSLHESQELSLADATDKLQLPEPATGVLESASAWADGVLEQCQSLHISVLPFGSPSYPSQLMRLSDPPALLFSIGRFDAGRGPRVAVIGTRKPTPWGETTAAACAEQIARAKGIVVSGLALGIDTVAQQSSIQHDGETWAVLAHGLHTVSPSSNKALAKRIADCGALISEYPPGESARRHYFVERDRIQAGLADAVLVIESGKDGGAMHTVRFAQQAGVPVWATFPEAMIGTTDLRDLPEPQQGIWELLRARGATRVTTAKTLDKMISDLPEPRAEPNQLFSP